MRRFTIVSLVSLVALVSAGFAVAHGDRQKRTNAVAATFTAAATEHTKTRQCTGDDGTYSVTYGSYEGTSTGDARLSGKIVLRLKSVVNLTSGLGWTKGYAIVRGADGRLKAKTHLVAVNTQRGVLNGLVNGRVKEAGHLLANFSASLSSSGALAGELGGGSAQNTAIVTSGGCEKHDGWGGHDGSWGDWRGDR